MRSMLPTCLSLMLLAATGPAPAHAQSEIGFIEKFATAVDRRVPLQELIPGTEDYFYYHTLHLQNQRQLAEAQSMLDAWRAKFGDTPNVVRMDARQQLLSYDNQPQRTLDYLRDRLGLQLEHAPPNRDRAAALRHELDNAPLAAQVLIAAAIARDRSLSQLETRTLPRLVNLEMPPDQLRAWLQRLDRADISGLVPRIAEELALRDSPGFGWANVHNLLSLAQLRELQQLRPQLIEQDRFVHAVAARLAPAEGVSLEEPAARRAYLNRLAELARSLPPSQNSLKALVLGNLLRLNLRENKFDRALFLEYLALPRNQPYYDLQRFRNQNVALADLNFSLAPVVPLPPLGDDSDLVRRHLEHFLQHDDRLDEFPRLLDRGYVERILAETKILYGLGEAADWYGKLTPDQQKQLRDRIELRFAPHNPQFFSASDTPRLQLEVKHVEEVLVKVYQINPRNYYRTHNAPIHTGIDLDGLVANVEHTLTFNHPADRRHLETLDLPELEGRGVWIIDVLGGGQRSRALIQKGTLSSVQRLTDAGHVLRIFDEQGAAVASATVEFNGQQFTPDSQGRIFIPYSEQDRQQPISLVDGEFAALESLNMRSETYTLEAGFVVDPQSLIAGAQADILVRARLTCNGRPISLKLLEDPRLSITAVDTDGLSTEQTLTNISLLDTTELTHRFLVPQRLASLTLTLSGRVYNQSRDQRDDVSSSRTIAANSLASTSQIGDFYLRRVADGYRLHVLGRNGEPVGKLPVQLSLKTEYLTQPQNFTLATDAAGVIRLGPLAGVQHFTVSSQNLRSATFNVLQPQRHWPSHIQTAQDTSIVLPLGADSAPARAFALHEVRRGAIYRTLSGELQIEAGALVLPKLAAGNYRLHDYETGQPPTVITVIDGDVAAGERLAIGKTRAGEVETRAPLFIRSANVENGELRIELSGVDQATHLDIIATPLLPDRDPSRALRFPFQSQLLHARPQTPSFYLDALKLDEEYSYILRRLSGKKYPGNLLPQPTLLVHPWETSRTDNQSKQAAAGDQVPQSSAPMAPPASESQVALGDERLAGPSQRSYDFLASGTRILANVPIAADGTVVLPLQGLDGYSNLSVIAIHPTAIDSRAVALPETPLPVRDQRLKEAFPADSHLAQSQTVRVLAAGEKTELGDARTSRVQLYTTLGDVYRLYGTLLNDPQWEKFRFLTRWQELPMEQRQQKYSELACHELNFFLYRKDRKFFDDVVAPLLEQKLEKQLVDRWLLNQPLDEYTELWRLRRLNTLERILLAQRLEAQVAGTQRWLGDYLKAYPLDPQARSQRFEIALRGTLLDVDSEKSRPISDELSRKAAEPHDPSSGLALNYAADAPHELGKQLRGAPANGMMGGMGGMMGGAGGMGMGAAEAGQDFGRDGLEMDTPALAMGGEDKRQREERGAAPQSAARMRRNNAARPGSPAQPADSLRGLAESEDLNAQSQAGAQGYFFEADRLSENRALGRGGRFFQSLDATREWAESQYFRVRLANQSPELISANPFWEEYLLHDREQPFLSQTLDLPVGSINEALVALAVLDLPFESDPVDMAVEEDRLVVTSPRAAIAYVETISPAEDAQAPASILVGQDIYLAEPATNEDANRPVQDQPLLTGVPYRTSIVVTNPTSTEKRVQVLYQLPAGALPLAGSRLTRSTPVTLQPYSTAQVQYTFYFPEAGSFAHYGAQVSQAGQHLAASSSVTLTVLAEPESVDEHTWSYIADWASNERVLEYLQRANLERIDLSRIAFRMRDAEFYRQVLDLLSRSGRFVPELWAYAVRHNVPADIEQLLQHRRDFTTQLGPGLVSSLLELDAREQFSYEHLDYKPLVVARIHQLGSTRVVLNDALYRQYMRLLDVLAHQTQLDAGQRMELCYYMLLQNRIEEALEWLDTVDPESLVTRLQYDYFDAYLDFHRGRFDRAGEIAGRYSSYPVPRWRELFAQVSDHLRQRRVLQSGQELASITSLDSGLERQERLLTDQREAQQTRQAAEAPALEFTLNDGVPTIAYRNLGEVSIRYYLMDIELLFSRNPFVSQATNRLPAIQPNLSETLKLEQAPGTRQLTLPAPVRNRNVLIEVTSQGISRSQVLTANTLSVSVAEGFGRVQVFSQSDRQPLEAAYVKVYARHNDGSVRFYKDGYTDLRGQFDYASLSTPDLDTAQRFAILVMHPNHGAIVREATPPTR
jgi:hypothetical protein